VSMTCPRTDVKLTLTITLLCKLVNSIFQYFNPQRVNLHCIAGTGTFALLSRKESHKLRHSS
jgi:protein tyrosine phosphatase